MGSLRTLFTFLTIIQSAARRLLFVGLATLMWVWPVTASAASSSTVLDQAAVNQHFARMANAFREQNYVGVFVYARGNKSDTVKVFHQIKDGVERERMVHLDGPSQELVREGDKVTCVNSAEWKGDVVRFTPTGPFAKALLRDTSQLDHGYRFFERGGQRLVGREATRLVIKPLDQYRYGYRIWLDKETGLLLKSEVTSRKEVLERFQFVDLTLDAEINEADLAIGIKGDIRSTPILGVSESKAKIMDDSPARWAIAWKPEGFKMAMVGIRRGNAKETITYTDGMAAFSVFVDKTNTADYEEITTRQGATVAYERVLETTEGPRAVTVVGEIPLAAAQRIAASVVPTAK